MLNLLFPKRLALCFHSIDNMNYRFSISKGEFESFINWLCKSGYSFLLAKDFAGYSGRKKVCTITFDDGCKSILLIKKFLNSRNLPYTLFISTGFVNKGMSSFLSTEDIKDMSKRKNVEIGSHSESHCDLTSIYDVDLKNELLESKLNLSELIGRDVVSFAYPFGSFNDSIIKEVRRHYKNAFSVYKSKKCDYTFSIPRMDINSTNINNYVLFLKDMCRYLYAKY